MKKIYYEHLAKRNLPENFNQKDISLFAHELTKEIHATTIELVENVDILDDTVFNRNEWQFYLKYTHVTPLSLGNKIKRLFMYFGSFDQISKGIWIKDNWCWPYFHWFTDALTRLIALECYLDSHTVILPREYEKIKYIKQSLEVLNIEVTYYNSSKRFHVKELIFPSHTAPTGNYNKEIIIKLRDKFISKSNDIRNRKVYISRQNARIRKVTNEKDLLPLLESYGFEFHIFEDYDFSTQVEIMHQTSHLIGLHGAGLTNMLFMPANGKILELRNSDDAHNNCFFSLASDLDHKYYYLINEGDTRDTHIVNITVCIKQFSEVLELMMT